MDRPSGNPRGPHAVLRLFGEEPGLALTGILGVVLAGLVAAVAVVRGFQIPPEGNLMKPITFLFAVGLFVLTTALLLPLAGFSDRARRAGRRTAIACTLYSFGVETVQLLRGFDPRFTQAGGGADRLLGILFGLASLTFIGCYVVLTRRFFARRSPAPGPLARGIRCGLVAFLTALAAGLRMISLQSRHVGADGNLIGVHALSFHGLQEVPLTG